MDECMIEFGFFLLSFSFFFFPDEREEIIQRVDDGDMEKIKRQSLAIMMDRSNS
jgi:hypothetical protein